jgi:hypothetical protein
MMNIELSANAVDELVDQHASEMLMFANQLWIDASMCFIIVYSAYPSYKKW